MIKDLPRNSILVLGKDSWDNDIDSQVEQLREYIEKGGRVVCLEQDPVKFNQPWLLILVRFLEESNNDPVYLSPSLAYKDGMNIDLERPYHPVFKGLTPKRFKLWSDHTSYDEPQKGFPAIYPVNRGYDLHAADSKNVTILANYSRALSATALPELFMGKESVLLSGFDLINHYGAGPIVDKPLSNILHYMVTDKRYEPYVTVTDSIVWGDYASERGIVNAFCSGLMVNTVPIIPKGQEENAKYKLEIDEYGYQHAGSHGGWNSKPGVRYVPYGRRPTAPFTLSRGGSPLVKKSPVIGEGYFYITLPEKRDTTTTISENPVNKPIRISLFVNDEAGKEYVILPKQ